MYLCLVCSRVRSCAWFGGYTSDTAPALKVFPGLAERPVRTSQNNVLVLVSEHVGFGFFLVSSRGSGRAHLSREPILSHEAICTNPALQPMPPAPAPKPELCAEASCLARVPTQTPAWSCIGGFRGNSLGKASFLAAPDVSYRPWKPFLNRMQGQDARTAQPNTW